jgi:hypothetical protein
MTAASFAPQPPPPLLCSSTSPPSLVAAVLVDFSHPPEEGLVRTFSPVSV